MHLGIVEAMESLSSQSLHNYHDANCTVSEREHKELSESEGISVSSGTMPNIASEASS